MPKNNLFLVRPAAEDPTPLTNYTMCPNWIYDRVLVAESASVAKVVLYVNRNTTGRSQAGQRANSVQASYGTIAREMNMSLRAVGEAVRTALAKGYIIQAKAGRAATPNTPGEGGWYSLNWQWGDGSNTQDVNSYVKLEVVADEPKTDLAQPVRSARFAGSVNPNRQNLPDQVGQNLPPCLNKTESESNKRFDLRVGSFQRGETVSPVNSTQDEGPKTASIKPKRQGSAIIGRLITDFTREMGDAPDLLLPNISRTLGLWQRSGLDETTFIGRLYAARKRVLSSATLIWYKRQTTDGQPSDYPNRMPYFFRVLENLLEAPAALDPIQEAGDARPPLEPSITTLPAVPISVLPAESTVVTEQADYQETLPPASSTPAETGWPATPAEPKIVVEAVVGKDQAATSSPPLAVVTPPAPPKMSVIQTWAARWTLDAVATLDQWQALCDHLDTPLRTIIGEKVLGIPEALADPTLRTVVGLETARPSTSTNIIVLFRNSFEANYLSRYLIEATDAFSSQLGRPVKLHSVCMD